MARIESGPLVALVVGRPEGLDRRQEGVAAEAASHGLILRVDQDHGARLQDRLARDRLAVDIAVVGYADVVAEDLRSQTVDERRYLVRGYVLHLGPGFRLPRVGVEVVNQEPPVAQPVVATSGV